MSELQPYLFVSYGFPEAEQVHTKVRFETKSLFVGNTTTMYCQFKLISSQDLPVTNLRPDFAKESIRVQFNGKQLPSLLPTTRIGQFKTLVTPQPGLNQLMIFYNDALIYTQDIMAKPTFEPNEHLKLKQLQALATQTTLARLLSPMLGSVGKIVVRCPQQIRAGYYIDGQSYMVDVEPGVLEIVADGDTMFVGDKALGGLQKKDILICFQLKAGRSIEILEM